VSVNKHQGYTTPHTVSVLRSARGRPPLESKSMVYHSHKSRGIRLSDHFVIKLISLAFGAELEIIKSTLSNCLVSLCVNRVGSLESL